MGLKRTNQKRPARLKRTDQRLKRRINNQMPMHLDNLENTMAEISLLDGFLFDDKNYLKTRNSKLKELKAEALDTTVDIIVRQQLKDYEFAKYIKQNPKIIAKVLRNIEKKMASIREKYRQIEEIDYSKLSEKQIKEIEKLKKEYFQLYLKKQNIRELSKLSHKQIAELGKLKH